MIRDGSPSVRPNEVSTLTSAYTPFSVSVVPDRDRVAVVVSGDVDMSTADAVARAVEDLWHTGFDRVVLDLRQVEFIDSTGLRALLSLRNAAVRNGRELVAVPAQPGAQRIFRVTGTHGLFDWRPGPTA